MRIHQILASLEYGDAVASHALALQRELRARGHDSEIFAAKRHPRATAPSHPLEEVPAERDVVLVYHHAFWSDEIQACVDRVRGRLALVYHNVTPDHWFAPYSAEIRASARRGREAVPALRPRVDVALAVSEFNRAELEAWGYRDVALLPLAIDVEALRRGEPDEAVLARYRDGWTNFLFVGRLTPSKRQEDVIRVFAWYHRFVDDASRLLLVGAAPEIDDYRADLVRVSESCGVGAHVVFAGKVSSGELVAHYRAADVFLCLSEHEGFCVPLVEAMAYDVPVVARAAGAVPDTLGGAGVLVRDRHVPRTAEVVRLVLSDPELHAAVREGQRRRLASFGPERFAAAVDAFLARL